VLGIHIGVSVCKQEAVTGTEPKREHQSNRDTERRDGTGVGVRDRGVAPVRPRPVVVELAHPPPPSGHKERLS
jgi:hypothetical protein